MLKLWLAGWLAGWLDLFKVLTLVEFCELVKDVFFKPGPLNKFKGSETLSIAFHTFINNRRLDSCLDSFYLLLLKLGCII